MCQWIRCHFVTTNQGTTNALAQGTFVPLFRHPEPKTTRLQKTQPPVLYNARSPARAQRQPLQDTLCATQLFRRQLDSPEHRWAEQAPISSLLGKRPS